MWPLIKKSKNIEHKRNITEKWTVQDTGVVKEEVLWKTGTVFRDENEHKIYVRTNFSQGTMSTFPSLQTISTINHRKYLFYWLSPEILTTHINIFSK